MEIEIVFTLIKFTVPTLVAFAVFMYLGRRHYKKLVEDTFVSTMVDSTCMVRFVGGPFDGKVAEFYQPGEHITNTSLGRFYNYSLLKLYALPDHTVHAIYVLEGMDQNDNRIAVALYEAGQAMRRLKEVA